MWNGWIRDAGFADEASLRAWLNETGVTGYPQMRLVMERSPILPNESSLPFRTYKPYLLGF